jgi:hypothetical protein
MFWFPFFKRRWQAAGVISDSRIELQFDVEKPVDLVDLTLAFATFSRQYKKFIGSGGITAGNSVARCPNK